MSMFYDLRLKSCSVLKASILIAISALTFALPNQSDANSSNGKLLYNTKPQGVSGTKTACIDCHAANPKDDPYLKRQSIWTAVNIAGAIRNPLKTDMRFLDNVWTYDQLKDIAAYISNPNVIDQLPAINVTPDSISFPTTTINTSTTSTIQITNIGEGNLTVTQLSVNGNAFKLKSGGSCSPTLPWSLGKLKSCTISVEFTPTTIGNFNGLLTITHNASTTAKTIPLTGKSQAGGTSPPPPSGSQLTVPSITQFTDTNIGNSITQTITVANPNASSVSISQTTIAGVHANDFTRTGGTCPNTSGTLAAKASCTIIVQFKPTATGDRTATITLSNSSGSLGLSELKGKGLAALVPSATLTPSNIILSGGVKDGVFSERITLQNTGSTTLNIGSITLQDENNAALGASPIQIASNSTCASNSTLNQGQSCLIVIQVTPSTVGDFQATLTVPITGLTSPKTTITAKVLATSLTDPMPLTLSASAIDFGTVRANTTVQRSLTISNPTDYPVAIQYLNGQSPSLGLQIEPKSVCRAGLTLEAKSSCELVMSFTPTSNYPLRESLMVGASGKNAVVEITATPKIGSEITPPITEGGTGGTASTDDGGGCTQNSSHFDWSLLLMLMMTFAWRLKRHQIH